MTVTNENIFFKNLSYLSFVRIQVESHLIDSDSLALSFSLVHKWTFSRLNEALVNYFSQEAIFHRIARHQSVAHLLVEAKMSVQFASVRSYVLDCRCCVTSLHLGQHERDKLLHLLAVPQIADLVQGMGLVSIQYFLPLCKSCNFSRHAIIRQDVIHVFLRFEQKLRFSAKRILQIVSEHQLGSHTSGLVGIVHCIEKTLLLDQQVRLESDVSIHFAVQGGRPEVLHHPVGSWLQKETLVSDDFQVGGELILQIATKNVDELCVHFYYFLLLKEKLSK